MSPPTRAKLTLTSLELSSGSLEETMAALRRHARSDALAELERWVPTFHFNSSAIRELTQWVREECLIHVRSDRFEYAIALIERYRKQPSEGLTR